MLSLQWLRVADVAQVQSLAQELPHALGVARKKKKYIYIYIYTHIYIYSNHPLVGFEPATRVVSCSGSVI